MIPNCYEVSPRLTVRACQTTKLKAGMISLSVVNPISKEDAYLTSLLLSVLHRGTVSYPSLAALNRRLDYLYGTELSVRNYYRGELHIFGIAADLLGEEYLPKGQGERLMEDVLEVMHEILFRPLTDENGLLETRYVESEKELQCDAIRSLKNSPRAYAIEHCSAIVYENERCGAPIYGTEEDVQSVTSERLTAHWKKLLSDLKFDFFYIGPDSPETVCDRVRRVFGTTVENVCAKTASAIEPPVRRTEKVRRGEEELPVAQGQLVLAFRTGVTVSDADYYACTVMNEMLGVSPVSKLFVNVRERKGLCYHCSSHYNLYKGVILVNCGLHPSNREVAEREILKQIEQLSNGAFEDHEIHAAKRSLANAYRQIEDNPTALESYYFGRALYGVSDSLRDATEGFERVTRADIVRVAQGVTLDTVYFLNGTMPSDGEEAEYEAD